MKRMARFCLLVAFVLLGCHKKESPPPAAPVSQETAAPEAPSAAQPQAAVPPPPVAQAQPAKPLPPPPAFVTANADNNVRHDVVGQVDGALTAALRAYVNKKGRMPGSFFEF